MSTQVRLMREEEAKLVKTLARKAFGWVEGLFIGLPEWAYVIEVDGEIAGSMMVEDISGKVKIAYLDYAFIAKEYQGQGLGKELYTYVVDQLAEEDYQVQLSLIRADNVASWKPLIEHDFVKGRLRDLFIGENRFILWPLLLKTPFLYAYGMNYYIHKDPSVSSKPIKGYQEYFYFLSINIGIALVNGILNMREIFFYLPLANLIVLLLLTIGRYIGTILSPQHAWTFQGTQGGIGLGLILNIVGMGSFPIHGSFYPTHWKADKVQRDLALGEIFAWGLLVACVLLLRGQMGLLRMIRQMSEVFLFLYIFPCYPFDEYGSQRIYHYSWLLWGVVAGVSGLILFV